MQIKLEYELEEEDSPPATPSHPQQSPDGQGPEEPTAEDNEAAKNFGRFLAYAGRLEYFDTICRECQRGVLAWLIKANGWSSPGFNAILWELHISFDNYFDLTAVRATEPSLLSQSVLDSIDHYEAWWAQVLADKESLWTWVSNQTAGTAPYGEGRLAKSHRMEQADRAGRFWAAQFWTGVAGKYTDIDLVQNRNMEDFLTRVAQTYFDVLSAQTFLATIFPEACSCARRQIKYEEQPVACCDDIWPEASTASSLPKLLVPRDPRRTPEADPKYNQKHRAKLDEIIEYDGEPTAQVALTTCGFLTREIGAPIWNFKFVLKGRSVELDTGKEKLLTAFGCFFRHWRSDAVQGQLDTLRTFFGRELPGRRERLMLDIARPIARPLDSAAEKLHSPIDEYGFPCRLM